MLCELLLYAPQHFQHDPSWLVLFGQLQGEFIEDAVCGACVVDHVEGIGHGNDSRSQWNILAREAIGVAFAVEAFVVMPDDEPTQVRIGGCHR